MSTLSDAGKLLKGSERESKFNVKALAGVVIGGIVLWVCANVALGRYQVPTAVEAQVIEVATVEVPVSPTAYVVAMDPSPTPWPTPMVIEREVLVEVTREVPGQPIYVSVPGPTVEVTRVVEVTAIPLPTVTPIPLAAGTIQICASVEGATALYIGNEGVVSGQCKSYSFGVGQTTILVQVNR